MLKKFKKAPDSIKFVLSADSSAQLQELKVLSRDDSEEEYGARHLKRNRRKNIVNVVVVIVSALLAGLAAVFCVLLFTSDLDLKSARSDTSATNTNPQSVDEPANDSTAIEPTAEPDASQTPNTVEEPFNPKKPPTNFNAGDYTVDVLNGDGTKGIASAVSDKLNFSGYKQGTKANAHFFVYDYTRVIYVNDSQKKVAEDIVRRLGCGSIKLDGDGYYQSNYRLEFTGDILVIVGGDFNV